MNRRIFVQGLIGSALSLPLGLQAVAGQSPTQLRYLSARADRDGHYFLSGFDQSGALRFDLPLPARGHGIAVHPHLGQVVQVARRPGHYLLVVDAASGRVLHRVEGREDRVFFGHGAFSGDGHWFFTTENDFGNGRGVIGVRDVLAGYRQVGELPSHGIGPHELRMLSDGRTLVVANGGILTHPDTGRSKLNLDSMSPSLAYIDSRSGALLEERRLPQELHQNSIRHLGTTHDDRVCFIMQYQGSKREHPPLVGMHRRGGEIRLSEAPADIQRRMRNYCGSACADRSGRWFAVSSPHGGLVTFWDAHNGAYAGHTEVADGCGIAMGERSGEFLLSSGQGAVLRHRVGEDGSRALTRVEDLGARWDNHMAVVAL
jgi:hypothetical protein